jgi:predicted TIM-barrel fold metal-dependent hydrolase
MIDRNTSRRELLKTLAAAGAAAVLPANGLIGQAKRGRIDVHHHHRLPAAGRGAGGRGGGGPAQNWTPAVSIENMDKFGIDTALVSLTQQADQIYDGTEKGRSFARSINEVGAQMARDFPGRFGLLASLPLPDQDGSLKEIEYAYDTLKADGVSLYTNTGERWIGDPAYAAVFDELNRRKAVVFVHPVTAKCCRNLIPGISDFAAEVEFETTRGVGSLLAGGTLARCRDVRFIFVHSGGALPAIAGRIKDRYSTDKQYKDRAPNGVMYELQRLYFDVAHASDPVPLGALMKFVPTSQILFGTDFPQESIATTSDELLKSGLPADTLAAIDRGNAERLFPRFKA